MSTFKKLLALTLALAMVLSVSAFAGYKADTYKDAASIDEDAAEAVELLYALDIMKGDENGNFNATATITRAEMAKMIYVVLNYGNDDKAVNYTGAKMFTDVPAGVWYEGYVNYCAAIKLVQGYQGKFSPNAPITCAEAAKMLLTAIGYSAEARGYTGANWDKNVLSDAAILGLLDGYKYNTNTYAPRQWVAVMFENMLLECLTFNTMVPTFSGLLTSGSNNDNTDYETMGEKYYDLEMFESVAVATPNAFISGDVVAKSKNVRFANKKEIRSTGLLAADLGQEYRVIYQAKNNDDYDGVAYSVRSLSETAEARLVDMEVEVKYGTSSNKAFNRYLFTIDGMEATFEASSINVLKTTTDGEKNAIKNDKNENTKIGFTTITPTALEDLIDDDRTSDLWKAIDTDCDGKIDYFFVSEYDYAQVDKVAEHKKYGEYIVATKVDGTDKVEFNGEDYLYLEDCIITDDEIAEDDVVKYTWDIDEGMYVMEVLSVVEEVEYEERDKKDEIYVLGGEEYMVADNGWKSECEDFLKDDDYLGETLNLVVDGDLIVSVWETDGNYDNMDKVNEQLALVIDVDNEYSNGTIREQKAIEYMTIDGETHVAVYQNKTDYVQFDDLWKSEENGGYDLTNYTDEDSKWYDPANYQVDNRLYILHEGTNGRVYLEEIVDADVNDQLSVKSSVLNGYDEDNAKLDATGSTVTFGGDKVEKENVFFVGAYNSDDEPVYKVMTAAELADGYDDEAWGEVLTYTNSKGTRTTVVGGYFFIDMESDTNAGYLYIDNIGNTTADGTKLDVTFDDGETASIVATNPVVDEENPENSLIEKVLYSYSYNVMDDEYTLTFVDMPAQNREIIDFDDDNNLYRKSAAGDVKVSEIDDDEIIAIVTIIVDRDQNQVAVEKDYPFYEFDIETIEFVALDDLTLDMIENDVDDDTYTQYTDYEYHDVYTDLLYVVKYQVMDTYDGVNPWDAE